MYTLFLYVLNLLINCYRPRWNGLGGSSLFACIFFVKSQFWSWWECGERPIGTGTHNTSALLIDWASLLFIPTWNQEQKARPSRSRVPWDMYATPREGAKRSAPKTRILQRVLSGVGLPPHNKTWRNVTHARYTLISIELNIFFRCARRISHRPWYQVKHKK